MTTFLLTIALLFSAGLALITFLASAARHMPLSPVDNLPDTSPVQQWTDQQIKYFRIKEGLRKLNAEIAADPGDEQPDDVKLEDAYSKKLRLNAEHEAELKDRRNARSVYHKAWYQKNKEARKAQVNARAQAIRQASKREAANQRMREQQLAYWTPERKAEQSRLTVERMAAKRPQPAIIVSAAALVCGREEPTYTYGQRALA